MFCAVTAPAASVVFEVEFTDCVLRVTCPSGSNNSLVSLTLSKSMRTDACARRGRLQGAFEHLFHGVRQA